MPIFYLDSGSIDNLEISSSLLVSGTLVVSGSLQTSGGGLTGSLLGTASLATTASYYQLVTGSSGTDFNITASLSGSIINIPDASSTARGLVTTAAQTFTGAKTFSSIIANAGGVAVQITSNNGQLSLNALRQEILINGSDTLRSNRTLIKPSVGGSVQLSLGIAPGVNNRVSEFVAYNSGSVNTSAFLSTGISSSIAYIDSNATGSGQSGLPLHLQVSGSSKLIIETDGNIQISGSLISTGSINASAGFTGSLFGTSSWAVSASWAPAGSGLSGGQDKYIARWDSATSITTSSLYEGDNKNIGVNVTTFNVTNPEALRVSGSTFNVISGEANLDNYIQLNIVNKGTGTVASSDIVATNNTGNEFGNYVDLGINGSNYAAGFIGAANDGYLYNTGSNFLIGNTTTGVNANLKFFAGNNATIFPIVVTGSVAILTGSLLGTASYVTGSVFTSANPALSASYALSASQATSALTASSIRPLNQQFIVTGSVIFSSSVSTQNELTVIGQAVITGSLIVSGTQGSGVFSKGGTIADFSNLISTSASYFVWRAPYSASVVALFGRRETGSATTAINARRSSSAGYALHTASNLVLGSDNTWTQANSVQNTTYAGGDSLEIIISGSNNRQVAVQVDFIKL